MAKKWYYNDDSGRIGNEEEWIMWPQLKAGLGWHGPFNTKDETIAYYQRMKPTHADWAEPTEDLGKATGNLAGGAATETADFLGFGGGQINAQNWFIRIGEILLGIVLIGVGVAKLTGTTNAISSLVKARIP